MRRVKERMSQNQSLLQKVKGLFGEQDMTVGNPLSVLVKFSIPLLIGNFAQQMYSTVDSIVVGKYVGDQALAAIGASGPIINLLLVLFMAISTGVGIQVAQFYGAKDKKTLASAVGGSITMILISSAVIMLVGIPLAGPMLKLIDTPSDIFFMARDYLVIIFAGIVGGGLYNIVSGILRGMGDSVYPLIFLLVATVGNIVLDVLFVAGFKMGVAGAAWATILAQFVSAALCVLRLFQMREKMELRASNLKPEGNLTRQLLRLGLPAGITQAIFSLAMVFVQTLVNQMGVDMMAVNVAIMRVDGFAMLPNFTFGLAMSTYVGQNMGARKLKRVDDGIKACLKLGLGVSLVLVACLLLFGHNLMTLFTETERIINLGQHGLRVLAVGYLAMMISQCLAGVLRGAGDTMPSMWISLFTTVIVRVPLAYLIAGLTKSAEWPAGHPNAIFFSLLICWVVGAVLNFVVFKKRDWRSRSLVDELK